MVVNDLGAGRNGAGGSMSAADAVADEIISAGGEAMPKMALVGLMQVLSLEGRKYDIRVNCLAPTAATCMMDGLAAENAERLRPEAVSRPCSLVHDDAPTRTVPCAGAGSSNRPGSCSRAACS